MLSVGVTACNSRLSSLLPVCMEITWRAQYKLLIDRGCALDPHPSNQIGHSSLPVNNNIKKNPMDIAHNICLQEFHI
jgi:hypothetical protein